MAWCAWLAGRVHRAAVWDAQPSMLHAHAYCVFTQVAVVCAVVTAACHGTCCAPTGHRCRKLVTTPVN